ncbi:GNAT family N-acetyltransferase [Streptomyces violaceusniger]|uniref:GNAT family N-acetyltransferase n=1 Tax=Streptomyces violaceusniger TaxID=68280 RepID=UPI00344412AA
MLIRPATVDDTPELMALRVEAEQWLTAAGIDQWTDPTTRPLALAKWRQDIQAGRTWVVVNRRAEVLATVTLGEADTDFWRPEDEPGAALYIYKLITSRAAAGDRLGGRILDWASTRAADQGRKWLRLDVWRTNLSLQSYYEAQGFTHLRTEAPEHRKSGWLGQRVAGSICHSQLELPEAAGRDAGAHASAASS